MDTCLVIIFFRLLFHAPAVIEIAVYKKEVYMARKWGEVILNSKL